MSALLNAAPRRTGRVLPLAFLAGILIAPAHNGANGGSDEAASRDPMIPSSSQSDATTLPLAAVTIVTGEPLRARRFFQGAMNMQLARHVLDDQTALALSAHFGLALEAGTAVDVLSQPDAPGAAVVRLIEVADDLPTRRPAYDARLIGPLGFGLPVNGLETRHAIANSLGFESTAGVMTMAFPRQDGSTYDVGEYHLKAPDDVLVLGVDRGPMQPIGPLDPALDIGGIAYGSMFVADLKANGAFLTEVLQYELRRETRFESGGPNGGLPGLERGERIAFQQWFSPGATTGYLVVMAHLDHPERAEAPRVVGPARGIVSWSFEVRDLDEALARWTRFSGETEPSVTSISLPPHGRYRTAMVALPDGTKVEFMEPQSPAALP
ncbi:MAG: VOC family protein [Gammaproteobacteria bacterium]|nr:VOC family protein [Gammaproteobacteria bacterium]